MNFQNDITVNNNITAVGTVQAANLTLTGLSANTYTSVLIENAGVVYKRDLSASLLPTGTEGQMLYNNAGVWTAFSGLFWDDTNNRHGIGVSSSLTATLHVRGAGTTSSTYTGRFEDSAGTEIFRVRDDGQVSVRLRQPDATYGANLITNGTFASDLSSWTVGGADWTWVSGAASHGATGANTLSQGTAVAGTHYRVLFTVVKTSGTNVAVSWGGLTMVTHTSNSTGVYIYDVLAGNTTGFVVTPTSDFVGTIDTVSVTAYTTGPAAGLTLYGTNGTSVAGEIRFSNVTNNIAIGLTALQKADASSTNNIGIGTNALTGLYYGLANIAIGTNAGAALNNAVNCVFIGHSAGNASTTGSYNTVVGATAYNAGTTGAGNTVLGYNALRSLTTNNYNVAIGYNALFTTNGTLNVAIGVNAGYTNSSGTGNICIGYNAGYYNATSSYCVAIGYQALLNAAGTSTGNIAIGYQALLSVASNTHTYNIGIGYNVGSALTTGSNNILIGYSTGDAISTGGMNICIGYNVDAQSGTLSNQLTLGNALFGVGIDGQNTSVSTGRLGAFVAAPTARFHLVAGAAAASNAPLKFTAGTNLTAAEAGAVEWDGTNLYITQTTGPTRKTIAYSDNVASMTITDDTTTNATMYPTWVTAASGNLAQKVSSTKLSFNPSTGTLTSTAFAGNLTGNVTGNCTGSSGSCTGNSASATYATNVTVTDDNATATSCYIPWVTTTTGNLPAKVSSTQLKFTPSTGLLECYGISSPSHAFSMSAGSFQINITSGITHSGVFTNSVGGKAIELTNGTSNWIQWGMAGIGAPTFTTSSVGTKLLLYPSVGASAADYAIGLESGVIWFGVPTTAGNFKWYGGTTNMMQLVNSILTIGGNVALHAGNYNTYAPTLTGTGASGTWGISISGSAASATTATNATNVAASAAAGTTNYLGMYTANTGNIPTYVSTSCVWNATSSTLTVPNLTVSTTLTATVSNATNATNTTNVGVTDDNATATSCYLAWVTSTSGNLPVKVSSTQLKFTPSTGLLECYGISSPSHAFSISAGSFQINVSSGITHSGIFTNSVGGKAIELTNGTSNWIQWGAAGVAAPTFTTSSAGTKLILYPAIGASSADYAVGVESGAVWYTVPTSSGSFKWYGGTTLLMTLTSSALTINGNTVIHSGNYNTYAPTLTGTGASGTWGISISGSAASATTATNATNTAITDDTASNATMYVTWVTANTGNLPQKVTSTKLTFNPSTGTLTATAFSGPLTGAVTGNVTGNCTGSSGSCTGNAASATYSSNSTVAAASGTTNYLGMYTANTGNIPTYVSTSCVWNATSSTLTVPNLTVSTTLTATVSNATNATNVGVTNDNATATTCYIPWVTTTSGNLPVKVSSTQLKFTPSTGLLECYGISSPSHAFSINTGSYTLSISGTIAHNGIFTNNVGGKAIELTNGTSNWIQWGTAGLGAPTFTTSSAGTKIIFYPLVGASSADYAMGLESGAIWFGVPTTSGTFKWYGGTTAMMTLFNSQLTTGLIMATGTNSGFIVGRRDTSAAAWQWYSSAGSLELYDHVNAATRLTWTTGGSLTISAASVTLNGATGLTVSGGQTILKAAAFGSAANYFAVFTGDPSTTGQAINTRTAAQVRSDISAASTGAATASGLTMSTARLLGRTTASTGAIEEISLANGSNCSATLSAGTLTIAISASPSFTDCTVSGKMNLPTSQPGSPVNGSAWWDAANNKLMIYNGTTTTWKGVVLT